MLIQEKLLVLVLDGPSIFSVLSISTIISTIDTHSFMRKFRNTMFSVSILFLGVFVPELLKM